MANGGIVVAVVLIVTFLLGAGWVMWTANDPPLLADPAPTGPPALLCPAPGPTTPALSTGTPGSGTSVPANSATPVTSTPVSTAPATSTPLVPAPVVSCGPGQVLYAPQYRGSYDPNVRLMALLGLVVPLLTTVVGFYFGQKAGAGASEAEKQRLVTKIMSTDPDGKSDEVTDLKRQLKQGGLL